MLKRALRYVRSYGIRAAASHLFKKTAYLLFPPARKVFCARLNDFVLPQELAENKENILVISYRSMDALPPGFVDDLFFKGTIYNLRPASPAMVNEFLDRFFRESALLWTCFAGKTLVGYLWTYMGSTEYSRVHFFPLGPEDAVILAVEIFPQFRGNEYLRKLTYFTFAELKKLGIKRVYTDILLTNRSSLRAFSKATFSSIGQARMKNFKHSQLVIWRRDNDPR